MDKKFSEQLEEIDKAYCQYLSMMDRLMPTLREKHKSSLLSLAEFANYYYGVKLLARNPQVPIPLMDCMVGEKK